MQEKKQPLDHPFEEISVPFNPLDQDMSSTTENLERKQFKEENNVHYESEENKKYRKKVCRLAERIKKIIKPRLYKDWEKRIFYLFFDLGQDCYRISKVLKISYFEVWNKLETLNRKIPKIYQCYQLFKSLKLEFEKYLTKDQYELFDLYYNKFMTMDKIARIQNVSRPSLSGRRERAVKRMIKNFSNENYRKFLKLEKIRFDRHY